MDSDVEIRLNAVIAAVTDEVPRVLVVMEDGLAALPFGPLDPLADRTLELALRRWVDEQTGLDIGYAEQLYTFGDRDRHLPSGEDVQRVISVAYLALAREAQPAVSRGAEWADWYAFFPWEDWREGRPELIEEVMEPALRRWIDEASGAERSGRTERCAITFGLGGAPWDDERVLERYELLYEAGMVAEAIRDDPHRPVEGSAELGRPMAFDHRRISATALGRLRGKLKYRPVVFELLPDTFTLLQLQRVVEALAGVRIHKQNFRRLVERGGLVEGTGEYERTGGRPAELFAFRREVSRERPAPGVRVPGPRRG